MKRRVYAVRDNTAGCFSGGLYLHASDAAAVRMFGDVASDKSNMIGLHPADFDLCTLAEFDESTGEIFPCGLPVTVITGAAWRAAQEALPNV